MQLSPIFLLGFPVSLDPTGVNSIKENPAMKNQKLRIFCILAIAFLLCSCKAYRNLENLNPKVLVEGRAGDFDVNSLNKLVEGDRIIVTTIDGKKHNLFYKRINGDQLLGTIINKGLNKSEKTENYELAITDIEKVWVLRKSAAATAPVVILGAVGLFFGILAIALSSGGGFGW